MDKANIAEWLLRRVVDPVRASELVGDQLEAHPAAGRGTFWISIARLLLIFSWRTLIGVAASPIVGLLLALAFFFFRSSQPVGIVGLSPTAVFHARNYLLGISILLWAVTFFRLCGLAGAVTLRELDLQRPYFGQSLHPSSGDGLPLSSSQSYGLALSCFARVARNEDGHWAFCAALLWQRG